MKKIIFIILFTIILIFQNNVFAINNTENNIKKAILVEDYIENHIDNIEYFIKKYDIKNNSKLNDDIKKLKISIEALKKIQNKNIDKKNAEVIMKAVLSNMKKINLNLKKILNVEKRKYQIELEKKKNIYVNLSYRLSTKISTIITKIAYNIATNKDSLGDDYYKIKKHLIKINTENNKLKNFGNKNYSSKKDIKKSFSRILVKIKKEFNSIKIILNKKG